MADSKDEKAEQAKGDAQETKTLFVKSTARPTRDGGNKTALFEVHPDHPGGQAHVAGPTPVEVAQTPEVSAALREGRIVEVSKSEKAAYDREQQQRAAAQAKCPNCGAVLPK